MLYERINIVIINNICRKIAHIDFLRITAHYIGKMMVL